MVLAWGVRRPAFSLRMLWLDGHDDSPWVLICPGTVFIPIENKCAEKDPDAFGSLRLSVGTGRVPKSTSICRQDLTNNDPNGHEE